MPTTDPINIIAAAIRAECTTLPVPGFAEGWAKVAANALTHDDIVANAVRALKNDEVMEGPNGLYLLSDAELSDVARVVLRSVGGA